MGFPEIDAEQRVADDVVTDDVSGGFDRNSAVDRVMAAPGMDDAQSAQGDPVGPDADHRTFPETIDDGLPLAV